MSLEQNPSNLTDVRAASPIEDLKHAPFPIRLGITFVGASIGSYLFCFGLMAIAGYWRESFFSPAQIGITLALLSLQALILWSLRLRPVAGNIAAGILWSAPVLYFVLNSAGPDDHAHAAMLATIPLAVCLVNGVLATTMMKALELPLRRRDEPI